MHRMLDIASKCVGPLELRNTGDVYGMRTRANTHRVEYGVRDRACLLVAGRDAKLLIIDATLNVHDFSIELDVGKQTELRGKVIQVVGIFLSGPEASLLV